MQQEDFTNLTQAEQNEFLILEEREENVKYKPVARIKKGYKRRGWNNYICLYSDFETTTEEVVKKISEQTGKEPDAKVLLSCIVSIDGYDRTKPVDINEMLKKQDIVLDTDIEHWLNSLYDFIFRKYTQQGFLKNNKNTTTLNACVYFHNLKFDGNFILKYFKHIEYIEKLKNESSNKQTTYFKLVNDVNDLNQFEAGYSFFGDDSKLYNIKLKKIKTINKHRYIFNIEFIDSLKLVSSSVRELGKSVKMCEGKFAKNADGSDIQIDYDVMPERHYLDYNEHFWKYCIRDCLIIAESVENFYDTVNNLDVVKEYNTLRTNKFKNAQAYKHIDLRLKKDGAGCNFTIASIDRELLNILGFLYVTKNNIKKREINGVKVKAEELITKQPFKNYKKLQPFYFGGLTQFSSKKHIPILEPDKYVSNSIDVNSAYPFWLTKDIPFGDILKKEPETGTYVTFYVIRIKKWNTFEKWKHLPIMKNWMKLNKYNYAEIFNIGSEEVWDEIRTELEFDEAANRYITTIVEQVYAFYIKEEWEAVLKTGSGEYEIVETFYMKTETCFAEFFHDIYQKRLEAKKAKNNAYSQSLKTTMNAFYGCTALRTDFTQKLIFNGWENRPVKEFETDEETNKTTFKLKNRTAYISKDIESEINFLSDVLNYETNTNETLNKWFEEHDKNGFKQAQTLNTYVMSCKFADELPENKLCNNKAIALTITARQRAYVINTINELGVEYVTYCDTDSIYFVNLPKTKWDEFEKKYCDNNELGKWKIEHKGKIMVYFWSGIAKKKLYAYIPLEAVEKFKNMNEKEQEAFLIEIGGYSISWSGANIFGDVSHLPTKQKELIIADRLNQLKNLIEVCESDELAYKWMMVENTVENFVDEKIKYGNVVYNEKLESFELDLPTNYLEPRYYRSGMTLVRTGTHITKIKGKQ